MKNINKIFTTLVLCTILIIANSCTSPKISGKKKITEVSSDISQIKIPSDKANLRNLHLRGKVKTNLNGTSNSASFDIKISGQDSLFMRILGPFSIEVLRFYANKDTFLAYNLMSGVAYSGKPDAESLRQAIGIGVSFEELVSLFRSEAPFGYKSYFMADCSSHSCEFGNSKHSYCSVGRDGKIFSYERKSAEYESLFTFELSNYQKINGFNLANNFNLIFPNIGNIEINVSDFEVNLEQIGKMSFSLPETQKIQNIGGVER